MSIFVVLSYSVYASESLTTSIVPQADRAKLAWRNNFERIKNNPKLYLSEIALCMNNRHDEAPGVVTRHQHLGDRPGDKSYHDPGNDAHLCTTFVFHHARGRREAIA